MFTPTRQRQPVRLAAILRNSPSIDAPTTATNLFCLRAKLQRCGRICGTVDGSIILGFGPNHALRTIVVLRRT